MRTIFPYFGSKKCYASMCWERFGDPNTYVEPFAGSLAVLLRRPAIYQNKRRFEIVGDLSGKICNFWRALKRDPESIAREIVYPPLHLDMQSRNDYLKQWFIDHQDQLRSDPHFCDIQIAAWWLWGQCLSIGLNFGGCNDPQVPNMAGSALSQVQSIYQVMSIDEAVEYNTRLLRKIADRLASVAVFNKPWKQCFSGRVMEHREAKEVAIFLDPPYKLEKRGKTYENEDQAEDAAIESYKWAIEHGEKYRIGYCCHEGDFEIPAGWEVNTRELHSHTSTINRGKVFDQVMFSPRCGMRGTLFEER